MKVRGYHRLGYGMRANKLSEDHVQQVIHGIGILHTPHCNTDLQCVPNQSSFWSPVRAHSGIFEQRHSRVVPTSSWNRSPVCTACPGIHLTSRIHVPLPNSRDRETIVDSCRRVEQESASGVNFTAQSGRSLTTRLIAWTSRGAL